MATHIFIDTNVYLNLYHYTKDDIAVFDKLYGLLRKGEIVLHLPNQVVDEWRRNRDAKLSVAAKDFAKTALADIPRHMHTLQMAQAYQEAVSKLKTARDHLIAEATAKARTFQLDVDITLSFLFAAGTTYEHDDEIFAKGKLRAERGNPPGKPGSFGDQYNWEMLLANVPAVDLYVVTKDGDYVSALDGKDERGMPYPNSFLRTEWVSKKDGANLYVFDSVKSLLAHYDRTLAQHAAPEIAVEHEPAAAEQEPVKPTAEVTTDEPAIEAAKVEEAPQPIVQNTTTDVTTFFEPSYLPLTPEQEAQKERAIEALEQSGSFATTHEAIAALNEFQDSFKTKEVERIFEAALSNSQVGWIITDSDVDSFYTRLFSRHLSHIDTAIVDRMIEILGLVADDEDDPFADGHDIG
ncbi:PIN domain-containing protein [Burkholderia vietnamiensis]|uniref:PIN domain-containing protein n=1 Tax=Burkholderia vietnamiensis TaxID=60552 RepID=UPI001CAEAEE1|nr:PIN domain-containing protein [Burkholderia vietnamiensis]CAG9229186.1 putative PIN_12 domain-containing protein [Burkholderia vietnamiensis]